MKIVTPVQHANKHRGASLVQIVLFVAVGVFLATIVTKLFDPISKDLAMTKVVSNLEEESGTLLEMSQSKLRNLVLRRAQQNRVGIDKDNIVIEKVSGGVNVKVDYETRTHLFMNASIVLTFDHLAELR